MKTILLSGTAAVLLLSASGAFAAQPDDQHRPDAGTSDTHPGADTHMSGPAGNHDTMSGAHNTPTTTTTTRHTRVRRTTHTTTTTTPGNHMGTPGADNNAHNDAMRGDNHNTGPNNGHPHPQIDVKFRIAVTATHHFHAAPYRAPPGYAYRRYNVGERLEPTFYARDYWLTDYATYDLMAPPDGYTWVRFGPDAMLIDEDTGEVIQVQYGVFD